MLEKHRQGTMEFTKKRLRNISVSRISPEPVLGSSARNSIKLDQVIKIAFGFGVLKLCFTQERPESSKMVASSPSNHGKTSYIGYIIRIIYMHQFTTAPPPTASWFSHLPSWGYRAKAERLSLYTCHRRRSFAFTNHEFLGYPLVIKRVNHVIWLAGKSAYVYSKLVLPLEGSHGSLFLAWNIHSHGHADWPHFDRLHLPPTLIRWARVRNHWAGCIFK